MTMTLRTGLTTMIVAAAMFAFGATAYAQTIEVTFESDPLFAGGSTVMPGDTLSRFFTVENTGGDTRTAYVRTVNDTQTGNLAAALLVTISEQGGATVYSGTLLDMFNRDTDNDAIPLGTSAAGNSQTYDFAVTFDPVSGNDYQNATAGFDLCVGFEGGNENCVTGSGNPSSGGGGGGGSNDDDDADDDLPPGIIAGESTSTGPFTFASSIVEPVTDFVRGNILGEGTTTDDTEGTVPTTTATESDMTVSRTSSPTAIFVNGEFCTLWWLLLLALMSFGWSFFEDRYRNTGTAFATLFSRQLIFTGGYVLLLFLFFVLGALETFWWLFAAAWAAMTIVDYRAHQEIGGWSPMHRNIFFAVASALLILTSFLFGFPCVWWPFLIVLVASGLLYSLER